MAANVISRSSAETSPGPTALRIWTLGQFRLERRNPHSDQNWSPVTGAGWQQRSVRALLGYLLCSAERTATRSQLLTAFWPGEPFEVSTIQLNRSLQALRKVLGLPAIKSGQVMSAEDLLLSNGDRITLAGQHNIWVDVEAFDNSVKQLGGLPPLTPDLVSDIDLEQREQALRQALNLYSGDFLPEEREAAWVMIRRAAMRRAWIELQLELVDLSVMRGAFSTSIEALDRLLVKDPTNEQAMQRLLIILLQSKRRSEALQAYKRFQEELQTKYQALASSQTQEIYAAVQQGRDLSYFSVISPLDRGREHEAQPVSQRSATTEHEANRLSSSAPLADTIAYSHQSVLIGRATELDVMSAMLTDVAQATLPLPSGSRRPMGIPLDTLRRPQCLFLMGDSGIGKTRLAEEMSREAQLQGWSVVWSRLYTQESGVPYRVWIEVLRKILNINPGLISVLSPELLYPLSTLLPTHVEHFLPALKMRQPAYALTPEQEQQRLWDAIGALLKLVSESAPLLIVLDDIQWADGSSQELLFNLARHLSGYPILFVATCRETEVSPDPIHPLRKNMLEMKREHTIRTLDIEPLTNEQIGQLVSSLSSLNEEIVRHIQDYAAGNPFFAIEMARSSPPALPKTVTDALGYRMKRLSDDCRRMLGHAAVLGGSFELQLICAMEAEGAVADDDGVLDLLDEARRAGVLIEEGSGTRITYHLWHPLLVGYLYENVSAMRRARLHRRAADALLKLNKRQEERVAATVCLHLEKAGAEPGRIAHYAELAGHSAYTVFAYSEAAYHYQRAVEYLEKTDVQDGQIHLFSLLELLAECTMIRGNYAQARSLYQRLLDLHRQILSLQPTTSSMQYEALLWIEIAWTWRYTGERESAWECCRQCQQLLEQAGVEGGPAWARLFYTQSNLYQLEGNYDQALQSARAALPLFEELQKQSQLRPPAERKSYKTLIQRTLEGDPINLGRLHRLMGVIAVARGQLARALEHNQQALALYEQYDERRQIAHLSCNIGFIHLQKAEYKQAQAALRRSLNIAEQINDDPLVALVYSNQGELARATENLAEAEELYERALKLGEYFQDREYMSRWNTGLAGVLQEREKLAEAAKCIAKAWSLGRAMNNTPCIAMSLVALGNLRIKQALLCPKTSPRRTHLLTQAQIDIERALNFDQLEVETRMKGQLYQAHLSLMLGKKTQALEALQRIIMEAQRYELGQVVESARHLLHREEQS